MIEDAEALANELDHTVGVVEHGLFLNMISKVIVGTPDGPVIIEKIGFSKEGRIYQRLSSYRDMV